MAKIKTDNLQKHLIKIAWIISLLFIIWVVFSNYQTINESILNPPIVQQSQLSAREIKIKNDKLEQVINFHQEKTKLSENTGSKSDPFKQLDLDITIE